MHALGCPCEVQAVCAEDGVGVAESEKWLCISHTLLVGGKACNYFLIRKEANSLPLGYCWWTVSVDASYTFLPKWYENTWVGHSCWVWRHASEKGGDVTWPRCSWGHMEGTPRELVAPLLALVTVSSRHLLIYDESWWGHSREAFLLSMGMRVQEYGHWIEINKQILCLSCRVSIGQMNWVSWIVISLFCYAWKGNSILKQG